MKKLSILLLLGVFILSSPAWALSKQVDVKINGLVCDFCAQAMEKVFGKQDEVADISVDLDTKIVTINMKDGQNMDDAVITKLITDSGYNVEEIMRHE